MKDYLDYLYMPEPTDRLFTVSKYYLRRKLARGAKQAGIKKIRIHDMRHSHAALLINMDKPILAISRRLGHESIETTLDTYGHLYPDKQKKLLVS